MHPCHFFGPSQNEDKFGHVIFFGPSQSEDNFSNVGHVTFSVF